MNRIGRDRHRIGTLALCRAILVMCIGYCARFGRSDLVTTGGVGIVAAVAATGIVTNALALHRDQ